MSHGDHPTSHKAWEIVPPVNNSCMVCLAEGLNLMLLVLKSNWESRRSGLRETTGTLRRPLEARLKLCSVFSKPRKAFSETEMMLQLFMCKLMTLRFLNRNSVRLPEKAVKNVV